MKHILTIAALMCAASAAASTPALSPRSAVMARSQSASTQISAYLTVDPATLDRDALDALGVAVSADFGDILTVRMPSDVLADVSSVAGVTYVQASAQVHPMLDIARPETGMQQVQAGTGLDAPYTGQGVVVGIVDCGFDYCHAAFRDAQGSLRIRRVWEQSAEPDADTRSPEAFGYGVELTDPAAIIAAGGDIRGNSHGTHVASIAAGSDRYLDGALLGMAPDADIVLVSMLESGGGNVCISDAIAYIFDYAASVGKPCVVNLSLGNHSGPHDGTSTFDVICDRLQGPGRLIVGSAGNHRADRFHVARTFASGEDAPLRTFVDYKTTVSDRNVGGEIEIWGTPGMDFEVTLIAYKVSTATDAERVTVYPSDETAASVSLGRNISGTFSVAAETSPLNGKPHVLLTSAVTSIRTGYAVALEIRPLGAGTVDVWGDNIKTGLTSRDIEGFSGPTDESTICEIGGTGRRILTVGAYTTRSKYTLIGETAERSLDETDGDAGSFSSCGPTADGRIKPQVSAPGCFISAAVSCNDNSGTLLYSQYHNEGGTDNYYGYMQGTSMSSPLVAGVVASWLEAYPELSPEELVEIVSLTSRRDTFTGDLTGDVTSGSCLWGYGKIDALAGVRECITRAGSGVCDITTDMADFPARVISSADGTVKLLFTRDCRETLTIHDTRGANIMQSDLSVRAGESVTMHLPSGILIMRIGHHTVKVNATR